MTTTAPHPAPVADAEDLPDDYLRRMFADDGWLAGQFPGYRMRQPQVDLAKATHRALAEGQHLIAEAPTGTGKSLAYAVPASWYARKHSRRVVICTANIALQEQLVSKDLPLIASLVPWRLRYALAKGRQNYLCTLRHVEHSAEVQAMPDVQAWIEATTSGDFNELAALLTDLRGDAMGSGPVFGTVKSMLSVSSDDCLGRECPHFKEECWPNKAKKIAEESDIIVTNYHMLFAHLKVAAATEGAVGVLPQFDAIIWDEAHKAADIAREFFGDRISYRSVQNVASRLGIDDRQALVSTATRFFELLIDYAKSPANDPRMRRPMPDEMWRPTFEALRHAVGQYERRSQDLLAVDPTRAKEMLGYAGRADRVAARLEAICTIADPRSVYFCDLQFDGRGQRPRVALCSKIIDVAPVINALLWSQVKASVQTSATLSVGGNFNFQMSETGTPELDASTLIVDTPFDYAKQCVLVVPDHLPEPAGYTRDAWESGATNEIADIVKLMGGRTLCLFTTYKLMQRVATVLPGALARAGLDVEVLVQGEAALRTKLVDRFRENESSVLLGTESFWAGVDVPGRSCSCVIIDKFPFPPPNDPIMDALQEQCGKDTFFKHSIPRAVIQFKQGFGRLIRRDDDRGFVVFLDKRIASKGYGRTFLRSLPSVRKVDRLTERLVSEIAP